MREHQRHGRGDSVLTLGTKRWGLLIPEPGGGLTIMVRVPRWRSMVSRLVSTAGALSLGMLAVRMILSIPGVPDSSFLKLGLYMVAGMVASLTFVRRQDGMVTFYEPFHIRPGEIDLFENTSILQHLHEYEHTMNPGARKMALKEMERARNFRRMNAQEEWVEQFLSRRKKD